jgi:hypothetical protein
VKLKIINTIVENLRNPTLERHGINVNMEATVPVHLYRIFGNVLPFGSWKPPKITHFLVRFSEMLENKALNQNSTNIRARKMTWAIDSYI